LLQKIGLAGIRT